MIRSVLIASAAALALAACDRAADTATGEGATAAAPSNRTLAAEIAGDAALSRAVDTAGLKGVLEGVGPYTVFAPSSLPAVGEGDAAAAETAALLRAHIVPGAVTRADLRSAIDRNGGQPVELRAMDGGLIRVTREGDTYTLATDGGATATLTGSETLASNGVVQPLSAALTPTA